MIRRANMRPVETIRQLAQFEGRGAGTNSERRAANWLADQVQWPGRTARIEPFWCRPNWALAHAWHVLIGLIGSLVSVSSPRVGGALILVALLSVIADELTGFSPGRRLTFEHASQNVIAGAPQPDQTQMRLIITANYDAGRTGLVYRDRMRAAAARLRHLTGGRGPGWLGWLCLLLLWLVAVAVFRLEGSKGTVVGAFQLIPTVVLVLMLALLLELASAGFSPAAADNGSGTAAAIALAGALDSSPPRNAAVEVVLQGAGDDGGLGLRRHLRKRRGGVKAHNTIVIGIGPCGAGRVRWWSSDGPLVPLRFLPRLQQLCADVAHELPELEAIPHRGRGWTPALPARAARLPAIAVGCLDDRGLVPRSHTAADTPEVIDARSVDDIVQFGLALVERIDAFLAANQAAEPPAKTAA